MGLPGTGWYFRRKIVQARAVMKAADLRIRVLPAISEVLAADWDACANPSPASIAPPSSPDKPGADDRGGQQQQGNQSLASEAPYNPFISHGFLACLEASNSVCARAGWQPQHLVAESSTDGVVGVMPCYLKSHS